MTDEERDNVTDQQIHEVQYECENSQHELTDSDTEYINEEWRELYREERERLQAGGVVDAAIIESLFYRDLPALDSAEDSQIDRDPKRGEPESADSSKRQMQPKEMGIWEGTLTERLLEEMFDLTDPHLPTEVVEEALSRATVKVHRMTTPLCDQEGRILFLSVLVLRDESRIAFIGHRDLPDGSNMIDAVACGPERTMEECAKEAIDAWLGKIAIPSGPFLFVERGWDDPP